MTWLPDLEDDEYSPANRRAREAEYPSHFLARKEGSLATAFAAEDLSLMSSVVYIRLGQNKVFMEKIEDIVRTEVRHRIDLENFDIYDEPPRKSRRKSSKRRKQPKAHEKPSDSENQRDGGAENKESLSYELDRLCEMLGR